MQLVVFVFFFFQSCFIFALLILLTEVAQRTTRQLHITHPSTQRIPARQTNLRIKTHQETSKHHNRPLNLLAGGPCPPTHIPNQQPLQGKWKTWSSNHLSPCEKETKYLYNNQRLKSRIDRLWWGEVGGRNPGNI